MSINDVNIENTQVVDVSALEGDGEALTLLSSFWQRQTDEILGINPSNEFKVQELPLARIKKIMKLDEDVKMISAEAPILFSKACELFTSELTTRAWVHTEENKRRTLQRNDIALAVSKYDMFDFLIDIVPRDEIKPAKKLNQIENEQVQYVVQLPGNIPSVLGNQQGMSITLSNAQQIVVNGSQLNQNSSSTYTQNSQETTQSSDQILQQQSNGQVTFNLQPSNVPINLPAVSN